MLPCPIRVLPRLTTSMKPIYLSRPFTTTLPKKAEGDTGAIRHGGERSSDTWSRREKAAEDMYIKEREKEIMVLLKEKIAAQEAALEKDRQVLREMEGEYGAVEDAWVSSRIGR